MDTQARVEVGPNGELILIDPVAAGVALAVAKHNCTHTLEAHQERIEHFRNRAVVLGYTPATAVILIACVDDPKGAILAEATMPGYDWQPIRDQGQIPFARGLSERAGVIKLLKILEPDTEFEENPDHLQVVVVDHGTFLIV